MSSPKTSTGRHHRHKRNGGLDIRGSSLEDLHHHLRSPSTPATIEYSLESSTPHGSTLGSSTALPASIGGDRNTRIYDKMSAQEQAECPFLGLDMQYHEKIAQQMSTILAIADPLVRGPLFAEHVQTIQTKLAEPTISLFLRGALQLLIIDSDTWNAHDLLSCIRSSLMDLEITSRHPLSKAEQACVTYMINLAKKYKESYEKRESGNQFTGENHIDGDGRKVDGGIQVNGEAIEMEHFPRPMKRVDARVPELRTKKRGCVSRLLCFIFSDD